MKSTSALMLALLTLFFGCGAALALEQEEVGNAPLNELNYKDWPGAMPLINDSSRVFHTWVNGNEYFYYRGDVAALNDALQKFAAIRAKAHEIVFRPIPGLTGTWDQKLTIPHNWDLHIVGGISSFMSKVDLGNKVWSESPMLSVYVGGDIQLAMIKIPPGATAINVSDLARRYREALVSREQEVRGWTAGELAELDPYDGESVAAITALLKDKDNWVRLNAASALPSFGKKAESALPALREAADTPDAGLKAGVEKAIDQIQNAKDNSAAKRDHDERLKQIADFCKSAQADSK